MTATPEAQTGPSAAAAEKPPVVEMVDLYLTAEAVRIAVPIVAEAGIADLLLEGPRSVSALAAATGLDADALGRLLRLLASLGVFAENGDGEYVNTRLSETLAAGAPMSMRDIAALALTPGWSEALAALPAAVREAGATAWDLAHGTPIFEYLPAHPDEATVFQSAMTMFSGAEAAAVTDAYDFSGIGTLVDVGGSQGVLLASILRATPSMRGVLFDLPVMVEGAAELFAARTGLPIERRSWAATSSSRSPQGTPTSSSTSSTTGTTSTASRFCAAAATRPSRAAGCSSSKKPSRPATRQAQGRSSTFSCSWWADASAHRPSTARSSNKPATSSNGSFQPRRHCT